MDSKIGKLLKDVWCGVGFEVWEVVDGWRRDGCDGGGGKLVLRGWLRPEVKSVEEFVDYLKSSGPSGAWYSEAGCVRR